MAVAEASFKISIDTMSEGLRNERGFILDCVLLAIPFVEYKLPPKLEKSVPPPELIGNPSTTYKGSFPPVIELIPRIIILILPPPGPPDVCDICAPAIFPCSISSKDGAEGILISSMFILEIAPVTSFFLCVPYPTTTTSPRDEFFGTIVIEATSVLSFTITSLV